jgi:hypothetical protein
MYLCVITKGREAKRVYMYEVSDECIDLSRKYRNDTPRAERRGSAWTHRRGASAVAQHQMIARMAAEQALRGE